MTFHTEDANFRPAVSLLYYWNTMCCEVRAEAEEKHDDVNITQHRSIAHCFREIDQK